VHFCGRFRETAAFTARSALSPARRSRQAQALGAADSGSREIQGRTPFGALACVLSKRQRGMTSGDEANEEGAIGRRE
jgi:hypothetical protein